MNNGQQIEVNETLKPVVLITGGSEGIGRALAELFAGRGDHLFLVARDENRLRIAADELERKWNNEVEIASVDLMAPGAPARLIEEVESRGFYVEHLINSAGIGFTGPFTETDLAGVSALIQLNSAAPTELMHLCLKGMLARKTGGILNIASLVGLIPVPNLAAYCASKSYLIAITRALAEELRNSGVNITVLVPGPVDTNFLSYGSNNGSDFQKFLPMLKPGGVARVGFEGYLSNQTVITPGFLNSFYRAGVKILPHKFMTRSLDIILRRLFAN